MPADGAFFALRALAFARMAVACALGGAMLTSQPRSAPRAPDVASRHAKHARRAHVPPPHRPAAAALMGPPAPVAAGAATPDVEAPALACFPLPVAAVIGYDFGDPRGGGRRHEGMDLLAPKGTPVRAVADGTVGWMHDQRGGRCCDLELEHDDGWSSRYIHLNNDTPGTDDGQGWGFADGIALGAKVHAGEVIGYVGDSGNAESGPPHLHFEMREPGGKAVDPRTVLVAACPTNVAVAESPPISEPQAARARPIAKSFTSRRPETKPPT